ncbi:MAG: hypothetical protein ACPL0A_03615, partial [Candidatus Micrarchaeia archaeon]
MKQVKIAISIDPKILSDVENTIDGVNIRNRSQAIAHLLRKALQNETSTAVILAGGKHGEEKAMRQFKGKPVIQHLMEWMRKYGINNFVIAISASDNSIRKYFGDGSRLNSRIFYLLETIPTGTA